VSLQPQQRLRLADQHEHDLGEIVVERIEGDLVFGQFTPAPGYASVASLFAQFAEAANEQLFTVVEELSASINALALHLSSPNGAKLPAIHDVQIGAGRITFRITPPADPARSSDRQRAATVPKA
jgi:hypothetical protein